jgi:hypothetical protein
MGSFLHRPCNLTKYGVSIQSAHTKTDIFGWPSRFLNLRRCFGVCEILQIRSIFSMIVHFSQQFKDRFNLKQFRPIVSFL